MDRLYAGETAVDVVLVTGVIGAGAAWLSGRAISASWRGQSHVILTTLLLAAAVRFFHFALFQGQLLSAASFACDALLFVVVGLVAWRTTRASLMVRQYPWLYARTGPLTWREIGQETRPEK
ncbi:MAG TPA: hypothetical protein VGG11_18180 [Xanthobacteraceae bacterium]